MHQPDSSRLPTGTPGTRLGGARALLVPEAFAKAVEAGRRMTLEQATAYALEAPGDG